MIKLPTTACTSVLKGTTITKFLGCHEVALWKRDCAQKGIKDPVSARTPGGLDAAFYWIQFPSVEAEYSRLTKLYSPDVVSLFYPSVDDLREKVDAELEKLADKGGLTIQEVPTVDGIVAGIMKDAGLDAAEIDEAGRFLARIGLTTLKDILAAPLSRLNEAPKIGPVIAKKMKELAVELQTVNEKQDAIAMVAGSTISLGKAE